MWSPPKAFTHAALSWEQWGIHGGLLGDGFIPQIFLLNCSPRFYACVYKEYNISTDLTNPTVWENLGSQARLPLSISGLGLTPLGTSLTQEHAHSAVSLSSTPLEGVPSWKSPLMEESWPTVPHYLSPSSAWSQVTHWTRKECQSPELTPLNA